MKLLSGTKKRRQISALERLEYQLTKSVKHNWVRATDGIGFERITTPLSEKDIKRIKQEIEILKSRV